MKKYLVDYDGWIVVEAKNENEAHNKANEYLSKSKLTNDGDVGEWFVTEIQEHEEEDED